MVAVSIILPVYNVENFLEKSLNSILNQSFENYEIILVNDGSTDNSGTICDFYKNKDHRIRVIHQRNQGSGYARNAGMKIATGEYLYFMDPDDYISANLVKDNYNLALESDAQVVLFGHSYEVHENKNIDKVFYIPKSNNCHNQTEFRDHFRIFHKDYPRNLWNKLYSHSFLKENKILFTNQKVGQDYLYNLNVYKELGILVVNKESYYNYVVREGSAVKRYFSDRAEMEYNLASSFENLIDYWNRKTEYKDLVLREFMEPLYIEMNRLNSKKCELGTNEKAIKLRNFSERYGVEEALNYFSTGKNNYKSKELKSVKIINFLLKNKLYTSTLLFSKLKNSIIKNSIVLKKIK